MGTVRDSDRHLKGPLSSRVGVWISGTSMIVDLQQSIDVRDFDFKKESLCRFVTWTYRRCRILFLLLKLTITLTSHLGSLGIRRVSGSVRPSSDGDDVVRGVVSGRDVVLITPILDRR